MIPFFFHFLFFFFFFFSLVEGLTKSLERKIKDLSAVLSLAVDRKRFTFESLASVTVQIFTRDPEKPLRYVDFRLARENPSV